jgi:streptogramin lyase
MAYSTRVRQGSHRLGLRLSATLGAASIAIALAAFGAAASRSEAARDLAARAQDSSASCPRGSVAARIGGKRQCLRAGKRCKTRFSRQYRRYGFRCVAGRLRRVPKTPKLPHFKGLRIVASIDAGEGYEAVTFGHGLLWTANVDHTFSVIDPRRNALSFTLAVGPRVPRHRGLAVSSEAVWVTNRDSVSRIDPQSRAVAATIPLPGGDSFDPSDIAAGFGSIWVTGQDSSKLVRISQTTNTVIAAVTVPSASSVTAAAGRIWVASRDQKKLVAFDPAANATVGETALGLAPDRITANDRNVWVTHSGGNAVSRVDPVSGGRSWTTRLSVGDCCPSFLAGDGDFVWTTNRNHLVGLDRAGKVVRWAKLGGTACCLGGVAVGDGSIWVKGFKHRTVYRLDPTR